MRIPSFNEIMSVSQTRGLLSEAPHLWDGLVGWWPLNEGGGDTAFDASGWGNHGTHQNGPTHTVGEKGRCVDFDGTDDYVQVPASELWNQPRISVLFWVYFDEWGASRTSNEWNAPIDTFGNNGSVHRFSFEADGTYGTTLEVKMSSTHVGVKYGMDNEVGSWNHVGMSYDGSIIRTYFNGLQQNTASDSSTVIAGGGFRIGGRNTHDVQLDGKINNVYIHNRALLPSEIQQLYADPWAMGRRRPTLVSFYISPTITYKYITLKQNNKFLSFKQ